MTTEAGQNRLDAEAPSKGRLLIVDDNRDFAKALCNLLALEGYEVEAAHDGDAARTALERFDAEVVLLDLRLEAGSGLDLIAPLKAQSPGLVFVIMTGYAETEAAVEALRHGAYDFLRKPIGDGELLAVLERAFERIRLEEAKLAAERALRESELRFRSVAQSAADAFVSADSAGNIVYWNTAAANIFGYKESEVLGRPLTVLMPARYWEDHESGLARLNASGESRLIGKTVELQGLKRDGTEFPVELSLATWTVGERNYYTGILRDITERKRAEQELRESEERLSSFINNIPNSIYLKDTEGRYVLVNDSAMKQYGLPKNRLIGKTVYDIHPKGEADATVKQDREVLKQGVPIEAERELTYPDGSKHNIIAVKFPVRGESGEIVGIGGINIDITERKRVEEQLRQAQKMEAVGQLTGGVAHDFNNLLAVVMGNLELIEDEMVGHESLREYLSAAISATDDAGALTQRLLAFARKQPLAPRTVDTNALVGEFIDFVRRTLDETIAIKTSFAAGLNPVYIDPGQLQSALLNLVVNARDAVGRSGDISIETAGVRIDAADAATDRDMDPGDYVALAVSDTGTGIAPDVLEQVFDPFFTTKDVGKGSGMGLSMVYGFAKQTGGHVTIDSELGRGTTVTIYLPSAARALDSDAQPAPPPLAAGAGETILVVEDKAEVRRLLVTILSGMGYKVHEAGDGESALAIMHEAPDIDLLLTDVMLPGGMDGVELAQETRRRRPHLPVVYASAYSAAALERQGRLDGSAQLIEKPFRRHDLAAKVAAMLESNF